MENGSVQGTLVFDLQEQSARDYFAAVFNQDQIERPFELSKDQIISTDGTTNYRTISEVIAKALQEVLDQRS